MINKTLSTIKENLFTFIICFFTIFLSISIAIIYKSSVLVFFSSLFSITTVLLTLNAKVIGSVVAIFDAIFYALVSYMNHFYGEVIIHVFIIIPISIYAIVEWFKNKNKSQIKIKKCSKKEILIIFIIALCLLVAFYFLLKLFNTEQLIPSTLSILFTSLACYFVARRSGFGFIMYILSDICLIVMWGSLIFLSNTYFIPILINSVLFLILDTFSYIKWNKIYNNQQKL